MSIDIEGVRLSKEALETSQEGQIVTVLLSKLEDNVQGSEVPKKWQEEGTVEEKITRQG